MRLVLIVIALYAYWLGLSGHYDTWFNTSGLVISVLVVAFSWSKGVADAEGFPVGLVPRGLLYWPWLLWQIVLSGLRVTRIILDPRLPISPTLVQVDALERTSVGLATYGNSITLTPGTLTLEACDTTQKLWIHALERGGAEGFADDEMNRRVAWFEKAQA